VSPAALRGGCTQIGSAAASSLSKENWWLLSRSFSVLPTIRATMSERAVFSKLGPLPKQVTMYEVGPRDGLQNEKEVIPTELKVELIERLARTGLKWVEATSFVSPKKIPQMADSIEVMTRLKRQPGIIYPVLVPNDKGYENATKTKCTHLAVMAAASERFAERNINSTIRESLARYREICSKAASDGLHVRGYISCVLGCPYEGYISPKKVADVAVELYEMGCYEISLGDTIGIGTPGSTHRMLEEVLKKIPVEKVAVHYHDTYGQALPNILTSLQFGIATVDASVSGLGGCPYAVGSTGNVATEDVVYMLHGMGIETGVNLNALVDVGDFISKELRRTPRSRVSSALVQKKKERMMRLAGGELDPAPHHDKEHSSSDNHRTTCV